MTPEELLEISQDNTGISFESMLEGRTVDGLVLEFGVAHGHTIREIARHCDKVYGFDWFKGLPEDWRNDVKKGAFECEIPEVPDNVELIVGLIEDTIDGFLEKHQGPASFIHIDVDIYSAASCILQKLKSRIVPGTIIAFDELLHYNGYENHEFKALLEFLNDTGHQIENMGARHGEARTFRIK